MNTFDTPLKALLAAMLLQNAFLTLMWLGLAWLRLARRAATHWGAAMLLLGCGMGLIVVRDYIDPWLGRWLANALNLVGFVLMARGAAVFTRSPRRDLEHGLVLALSLGGTAAVLAAGLDPRWISALASGAMTWVMLRTAWLAGRALHLEFGTAPAWLCAAPLAGLGLITGARAAGAVGGAPLGASLDPQAVVAGQTGLILAFIALALCTNGAFCGMVTLRLVGRLRHLSLHDALTGLPNRRSLQDALADEYQRVARGGPGFALLSMDVDHFKRVNDQHGHAAGDAALAHIAELIRGVARATDRPARMGGEEFALLMPQTDAEGARAAAERLMQALRERPLAYGGAELRLRLSIGAAVVGTASAPAEPALAALWQRVDAALYAAKAQGRDRLVFSEPA